MKFAKLSSYLPSQNSLRQQFEAGREEFSLKSCAIDKIKLKLLHTLVSVVGGKEREDETKTAPQRKRNFSN
jgi:hypothetical protein